ncbi:MAG: hypothetical protein ACK58L_17205, partial [Planctomycetota bacterium]
MNFPTYHNIVEEPPFHEWPCSIWSPKDTALQMLRRQARRRLVNAARTYTAHLSTVAGADTPDGNGALQVPDGDPDSCPIVMTGHQPVIFHAGLTYKYQKTQIFIREHSAIGIAVVIDTDEGDAGEFSCPVSEEDLSHRHTDQNLLERMQHLTTRRFSFATGNSLFVACRRRSSSEIQQISDVVLKNLRDCHCHRAVDAFQRFSDLYGRLQNPSMSEVNLIVRRAAGIGDQLMEVRLSEIGRLPESIQFFASLLRQPFSYARRYNEVLARFRATHRIRNQANPFPDLIVNPEECELPFWIVNLRTGTRSIPVVRRIAGVPALCGDDGLVVELLPGHEAAALFSLSIAQTPLIPRGPLITATMRLLFRDLFVHGIGGGHYDRFTDELIESWWNESASPLAVASASRYLFDAERSELDRLEQLAGRQRDLQFNPQGAMGSGIFPPGLEDVLCELITEK